MGQPVKRTPLHAWHLSQGARMADFGGYEMPLWYSSAKNEHLAVLTHAGLFDTSHMALVDVRGPGAHALLQRCFTNNLDACIGKSRKSISNGRCVYGAFLDEAGGVIDDGIVYKLSDGRYLVVVNAGMGAEIASHLMAHNPALESAVTDMTDRIGKIDIQGPMAARILSDVLVDAEKVFGTMPYFSFKGRLDTDCSEEQAVCLKNGLSILLSRTGYTGEFGFELFMAADKAVAAWETIVDVGRPRGLVTCGLAARDSLRGGAVLPLSRQDIGPWPFVHHPWPFALPWTADGTGFSKPFIGDQALLGVQDPRYTYAFVGFDLRKVSPRDPAIVINTRGEDIGRVLTCVSDMGIGYVDQQIFSIASPGRPKGFKPRGLCCGFIKVNEQLDAGAQVQLKDKRRTITVTIVDNIRPDRTARRLIGEMVYH